MRILIGLLICLCFSISVAGQGDCVIRFTYKWTLDSAASKEIELGLPTTQFLIGYTTDSDERSFQFFELNSKYEATLISHLSSDFCMNHDKVIERVFKGNKSNYLLKLRTKTNKPKKKFETKEIKIPLDSMSFFAEKENNTIIIQLPKIKTL